MASIRFYLDHPKDKNGKLKQSPVPVYLFLTMPAQRLRINTGIRILPNLWDTSRCRMKPQAAGSMNVNSKLAEIEKESFDCYLDYRHLGSIELRNKLKSRIGDTPKSENSILSILDIYHNIQSLRLRMNTLKKFKSLKMHLSGFYKKSGQLPTFNNLGMQFYDGFMDYLYEQPGGGDHKLLDNTVAMYFSKLHIFLSWALIREYHTNIDFKKWPAVPEKKVEYPILSEDELHQFYNYSFESKRLERVRDLFCFACYTGQRWSDVEQFDKKDMKGNTWILTQKKVDIQVHIPLIGFSSPAMDVLLKYDFKLPVISNQKMNEYIKEAGEVAKLNEPVIIKRSSRNDKIRLTGKKWEFLTFHMARRTCATLLLENGMPLTTVMKMLGWAKVNTAMKYEHTSTEAVERELRRIAKKTLMKVAK